MIKEGGIMSEKLGNDQAFPHEVEISPETYDVLSNTKISKKTICYPGMTTRQVAVIAAMQGLLANSNDEACVELGPKEIADCAVQYADAVLKREKETR
jgi:hypothetical protein